MPPERGASRGSRWTPGHLRPRILTVRQVGQRSAGIGGNHYACASSVLTLGACLTLKPPTFGRPQPTIGLLCATRRLRSCSR